MKIEITDDRKNPLLNRREIKFKVAYIGVTPKLMDVKKELVSTLKLDKNLTVVDNIKSEYGKQSATGYVKIYEDKESIDIEQKNKIKKNLEPEKETKSEKTDKEETKSEKTDKEETKSEKTDKEKTKSEKTPKEETKSKETPKEKTEKTTEGGGK